LVGRVHFCSCLVCIVVILCVLIVLRGYCFFTLDTGLLARSQYSECPANGHLETVLSWFPLRKSKYRNVFQNSKLQLHPSHVALQT